MEELVLESPEEAPIEELPGLLPFLDIDPTSPFFPHMAILCFVKEIWAEWPSGIEQRAHLRRARFLSAYPSCMRACRTR